MKNLRRVFRVTKSRPTMEGDGVTIKVIRGEVNGVQGPVRDLVVETEYLDVRQRGVAEWRHPVQAGKAAFAHVFEGAGYFDPDRGLKVTPGHLVLFQEGDAIQVSAGPEGVRFILVSGRVLNEPVAWRGPIVMNTEAELDLAFREYQAGTFIKN